MLASGFSAAPISRALLFYVVTSAVVVSALDAKPYFGYSAGLHLLQHGQWWRPLTWPACYVNSTEVLFAAVTLYQLRVVERLWGPRKFAVRFLFLFPPPLPIYRTLTLQAQSFLLSTLPYTTLLPPLILLALRALTLNTSALFDHVPAGPTALVFALLAQYHVAVPYTYRYRLSASRETGVLLTSKSLSYLPPLQLALSQAPASLVVALVGWGVGWAWRMEMLPGAAVAWRVPGWMVGAGGKRGGRDAVEGLRRRMVAEGEEVGAR